MPRAKKDGKFVNVYMEKSLSDAADRYSEETGVPKTKVIEKALEEYLKKQKPKKESAREGEHNE